MAGIAGFVRRPSAVLAVAAIPLMANGTWTGARSDDRAGERAFAILFWAVMVGCSTRPFVFLFTWPQPPGQVAIYTPT